jgi:hypothetical protein
MAIGAVELGATCQSCQDVLNIEYFRQPFLRHTGDIPWDLGLALTGTAVQALTSIMAALVTLRFLLALPNETLYFVLMVLVWIGVLYTRWLLSALLAMRRGPRALSLLFPT